jgi:hypothetical protein
MSLLGSMDSEMREMNLLNAHLTKLRQVFRNATFVVIDESNLSWLVSARLMGEAKKHRAHGPVYIYSTDTKHDRPGIWVTDIAKNRFVAHMVDLLFDNRVRFFRFMFTTDFDPADVQEETATREVRDLLITQVKLYRRVGHVVRRGGIEQCAWRLTGKGHGRKDDLVMCMLFTVYHAYMHTRLNDVTGEVGRSVKV